MRSAGPYLVALILALALINDLSRPAASSNLAVTALNPRVTDDNRVVYPQAHMPLLVLPNGQRWQVRSVLNFPQSLHFGEYRWDEKRIPAGEIRVRVDLDQQIISVFRGGDEIGTAVILYGTDGKPTPTGVFPIIEKREKHWSSLYDAPMPNMLRLTADGVAIHASEVRKGSATHGCIGIPAAFARLLFAQVKPGDLVAVLRSSDTH